MNIRAILENLLPGKKPKPIQSLTDPTLHLTVTPTQFPTEAGHSLMDQFAGKTDPKGIRIQLNHNGKIKYLHQSNPLICISLINGGLAAFSINDERKEIHIWTQTQVLSEQDEEKPFAIRRIFPDLKSYPSVQMKNYYGSNIAIIIRGNEYQHLGILNFENGHFESRAIANISCTLQMVPKTNEYIVSFKNGPSHIETYDHKFSHVQTLDASTCFFSPHTNWCIQTENSKEHFTTSLFRCTKHEGLYGFASPATLYDMVSHYGWLNERYFLYRSNSNYVYLFDTTTMAAFNLNLDIFDYRGHYNQTILKYNSNTKVIESLHVEDVVTNPEEVKAYANNGNAYKQACFEKLDPLVPIAALRTTICDYVLPNNSIFHKATYIRKAAEHKTPSPR